MFRVSQSGNFDKTKAFLTLASSQSYLAKLDALGAKGVNALRQATPEDSGETAASWEYHITRTQNSLSIVWTNRVMVGDVPLAVLLQYGHGTRNGGQVQGVDYINPAMKPIFDEIAEEAWRLLTGSR